MRIEWIQRRAGASAVWHWAVALLLLLALAACGGSSSDPEPAPTPEAKARTTVLVYMVGSDLEGEREPGQTGDMATGNIEELKRVGSSDDVHFILEMGGAKKAGWETVKRQRVLKGDLQLIEDLGPQRMSDPENLRKFIEWGVKAYPAHSYHLIFWNHGGGPLDGFGSDQNFPGTGMISMPDLAGALEDAQRSTQIKLDLLGFDACLMASVEVAQVLSPYGHYLVASQEVEPGNGWDWSAYATHLLETPDSTAVTTGKAIMDAYVAKMDAEAQVTVTSSLIDLSKVDALSQSLGQVFRSVSARLMVEDEDERYKAWADLAYARRTSHDFQTSWFFGGDNDLVDLGDFITVPKFADLSVPPEQIAQVRQALDEAVVYVKNGAQLWDASGLTMYFPLVTVKDALVYERYDPLAIPSHIKSLVRQYLAIANSEGWPTPTVGPVQNGAGDVRFAEVGNPAFQAVGYAVLWEVANGAKKMLALKPLDADMDESLRDPTEEGVSSLVIAAHEASGWLAMPGAHGNLVPVSVLPDDRPAFDVEAVRQHLVPVLVSGDNEMQQGSLIVQSTYEAGERVYRVVSFVDEDNNPYASRPNPDALKNIKTIYPLRWSEGRKWDPLLVTDQIAVKPFGDADTPREQWWTLELLDASMGLCHQGCQMELGVIDYKGRFQYSQN